MQPANWRAHWERLGDRVQKLKTARFQCVIIMRKGSAEADYLIIGRTMIDNPTHKECLTAIKHAGTEHVVVIQRKEVTPVSDGLG